METTQASGRSLILCVDDEPVNLDILEELLGERYDVEMARDGRACLGAVEARSPDMILLDVNMPDMDGLETCRRLKDDPATADIPVIFVSALATPEELIAGYEAGGADYLTKPFSAEILGKKIELALAGQRRTAELRQQTDSAMAALERTRGASEAFAGLVRFLDRVQRISSLDDAADGIFDCLREFELDGSLLLVDEPENRVRFSDDIDRPMESQILASLRDQDRVVSFGTRLAISSETATLLVRRLPSAPRQVDGLRAMLTILLNALDGRIHALRAQELLDRRRAALERVTALGGAALERLEDLFARHAAGDPVAAAEVEETLRGGIADLRALLEAAGAAPGPGEPDP